MNRTTLCGNLGADPESRTTNSGLCITNLRVATNERVKKGDDWEDHTEWHRVVMFGKRAEAAAKHLSKGSKVLITGKLRTKKYTDKEGVDRWSTDVICDDIEYLSPRNSSGGHSNGGQGRGYGGYEEDDSFPF